PNPGSFRPVIHTLPVLGATFLEKLCKSLHFLRIRKQSLLLHHRGLNNLKIRTLRLEASFPKRLPSLKQKPLVIGDISRGIKHMKKFQQFLTQLKLTAL
ncbi:MAG: hypothetical protein J2P37_36505, partial [Ktedonobacteraceae bacterium]|nr:hypothetical protein [Ktedonobacteraceae bacterium]